MLSQERLPYIQKYLCDQKCLSAFIQQGRWRKRLHLFESTSCLLCSRCFILIIFQELPTISPYRSLTPSGAVPNSDTLSYSANVVSPRLLCFRDTNSAFALNLIAASECWYLPISHFLQLVFTLHHCLHLQHLHSTAHPCTAFIHTTWLFVTYSKNI